MTDTLSKLNLSDAWIVLSQKVRTQPVHVFRVYASDQWMLFPWHTFLGGALQDDKTLMLEFAVGTIIVTGRAMPALCDLVCSYDVTLLKVREPDVTSVSFVPRQAPE